jgi:CheY-like chemotaxis protein
VVEASSGAAALEVLERADNRVELILADVVMPGINGVELASIVRRDWPALPVLLMTGYADSGLLRQSGKMDVLRKPFGSAELEEKLQQILARK